jgi:hypothetical protein
MRELFSRYENIYFHFKWLCIEETIKVRKELIDKIIPLPHTFFPSIKIKEREKIYSASLISRVSPPPIIRVLGNYDSFSSRTSIAKIVSKIPKSFVYLSYSGAKIFIGYQISQFSQVILSIHQAILYLLIIICKY